MSYTATHHRVSTRGSVQHALVLFLSFLGFAAIFRPPSVPVCSPAGGPQLFRSRSTRAQRRTPAAAAPLAPAVWPGMSPPRGPAPQALLSASSEPRPVSVSGWGDDEATLGGSALPSPGAQALAEGGRGTQGQTHFDAQGQAHGGGGAQGKGGSGADGGGGACLGSPTRSSYPSSPRRGVSSLVDSGLSPSPRRYEVRHGRTDARARQGREAPPGWDVRAPRLAFPLGWRWPSRGCSLAPASMSPAPTCLPWPRRRARVRPPASRLVALTVGSLRTGNKQNRTRRSPRHPSRRARSASWT